MWASLQRPQKCVTSMTILSLQESSNQTGAGAELLGSLRSAWQHVQVLKGTTNVLLGSQIGTPRVQTSEGRGTIDKQPLSESAVNHILPGAQSSSNLKISWNKSSMLFQDIMWVYQTVMHLSIQIGGGGGAFSMTYCIKNYIDVDRKMGLPSWH